MTTLGMRRNPDSSQKTMWAPRRAAFFNARPRLPFPPLDVWLVLLDGAPFRFLMTPVEAMHQTSNVMGVVVHAELLGDELGDTRLGPEIGAVAAPHRTLEK